MNNEQLQSETINYLRFPLIIAVVFIHSFGTPATYNPTASVESLYPIAFNIEYILSKIIAEIAVPLFFLISGFLFFKNIETFNRTVYKDKLVKRIRSLFIPYIFWNSLIILIYFFLENITYTPGLFSNKGMEVTSFSFIDFLNSYWSINGGFPILYQFWFIRDLIIVILFTPLIYVIVRYTKVVGVILFFLIWIIGIDTPNGFSPACWFFFLAGSYFSINKINLVTTLSKLTRLSFILYPLLIIADLLSMNQEYYSYIHKIGIVIGIVFAFCLVSKYISTGRFRNVEFLTSASFFVFATHEPWLFFLRRFVYRILKPTNELIFLIDYFIPAITIALISLAIYYFLRKKSSAFLRVISGGR